MTSCASAQVLSQRSWLPCLSSVSHSQPLDHVSSCSETRRIWVGKYSHMLQYIPCLSVEVPPCVLSSLPSSSRCLPSIAPCLPTYLPPFSPSLLSLPSFCPLRPVTIFPRRKSCSEPHLAKMMPLFQPHPPTGVENTCSSALHWSEGNWSNCSFFPMLGMKWNAHTYTAHITYIYTHTTGVSQKRHLTLKPYT